jgi:hypothetical protein
MTLISLKKEYIRTDGWRRYTQPINAVCGANDTGSWDDSPCPSKTRADELNQAKKLLRENKIPFRQTVCQTSNVFCVHVYLCVSPENKERARTILQPLESKTRLFYLL